MLEQITAKDGDAAQIAEAAVAVWHRIDEALWPIIGRAGVAALFKRSLYLARTDYPSLAAIYDVAIAPGDFAVLRDSLAQQASSDAAAVHAGLLTVFLDLLTSLIGAPLTERLLRSVWIHHSNGNHPSSGDAVQDTSP